LVKKEMFSSRKFAAKGKLTIYNVSSTSVWKVANLKKTKKENHFIMSKQIERRSRTCLDPTYRV
jgi:hypothetical protein